MNKEKALEKIKKCLELSKSSNEHEAAQALKQAQILMKNYELTIDHVSLSEISEVCADKKVAFNLARWQWNVVRLIANAFGCEYYKQGKSIHFYGLGSRPEAAAYAFEVVWRQISYARRKYLRECRPLPQAAVHIWQTVTVKAGYMERIKLYKSLLFPKRINKRWRNTITNPFMYIS